MAKRDVEDAPWTYTIPEAAKMLGISRNAGYEAAKRGELPLRQVGKRKLVLGAPFRRILNGEAA